MMVRKENKSHHADFWGPEMVSKILTRVEKYYTIYPAESVDRPEVITFLKAAYADQFNAADYKDEKDIIKRWEWANIKNPNKSSFQSSAWVCRENSSKRIVGLLGIIPVSLKCGDSYYPVAWGRDLIVLEEFRKMGVGPFLVASVLKKVKDTAAIFMLAGLNDRVYTMYKKFGFTDMGRIPLYVRVNRLHSIVRSKIRIRSFVPFISMLGNIALELFYIPARVRRYVCGKNKDVCIKKILYFDGSFNKLWRSASASFNLIVLRDSAYLNWRFVEQPYFGYAIFKATRKNSDEPVGYIVLREGNSRGLRTGVITDIFAPANDPDIIIALVNFAVSYFAKRDDIALIRCDILNKDIARVLRQFGFIRFFSNTRFIFTNIKNGLDVTFFTNRNNWFINYADSDLDLSGRK